MGAQSDIEVVANLEDGALRMFVRACDNHQRLDSEATPHMGELDDWFNENVAGTKIGV